MTTIAYKEGILACDSQATLGNLICNNDFEKVHRFDSEEFGSVYVACAGAVNHIAEALTFLETLFSGESPEAVRFDGQQMQILMLTEDSILYEGLLTEASTDISWIECEEPYAIGSGSHIAIGAMHYGASSEDAVKVASKLDCYTNDNVKVYKAEDLSYRHILESKKEFLQQQLDVVESELTSFIGNTSESLSEALCDDCYSKTCDCMGDHENVSDVIQFEVGDIVRVMYNEVGDEDPIRHVGTITVSKPEEDSYEVDDNWYYSSEELELIKKAVQDL